MQVQNLALPNLEELRQQVEKAAEKGKELNLRVARNNRVMDLRVQPDALPRGLGIRVEPTEPPAGRHPTQARAVGHRVRSMMEGYSAALGELFRKLWSREERGEVMIGPVSGAYQTGHIVARSGLGGWLVILATLNLGVAVTNLVPIPPQDGYRAIAEGVQALRHGKPVNPKVEKAMFLGGVAVIVAVSTYLVAKTS